MNLKIIVGVLFVIALTIGVLAGLGNEGPHNFVIYGHVVDERVIDGHATTGYAALDPDHMSRMDKLTNKLYDAVRAGDPMRLYRIEFNRVEYDEKKWFKDYHRVLEASVADSLLDTLMVENIKHSLFIKTEGDPGDIGDQFIVHGTGLPLAPVLSALGVKYDFQENGIKRTERIKRIASGDASYFSKP